jgi:hypothetical protein
VGNNSKTVNNIKNLTGEKNDQHSKIYRPCNLEMKIFEKVYDERRQRTPSDGNSSPDLSGQVS